MIVDDTNKNYRRFKKSVSIDGGVIVHGVAITSVDTGYWYNLIPTDSGWGAATLTTGQIVPTGIAMDSVGTGAECDFLVEGYFENAYSMCTAGNTYVAGDDLTFQTSGEIEPGGATYSSGSDECMGIVVSTSDTSTRYLNVWKLNAGWQPMRSTN